VLDDLPVDQVRPFEAALYKYVDTTNQGLLNAIMEKKVLDDNLKGEMSRVIKEAKQQFVDSRQAEAKADPKQSTGKSDTKQGADKADGKQVAKEEPEQAVAK
jgi:hypothetical protein